MSFRSNVGCFVFSFPTNALSAKLLHDFSAFCKQLGSIISEIIAIEVVGEVIPSNVAPLLPRGPDSSLHRLLCQPSCGRATAGGGTEQKETWAHYCRQKLQSTGLNKQQSPRAGACHRI